MGEVAVSDWSPHVPRVLSFADNECSKPLSLCFQFDFGNVVLFVCVIMLARFATHFSPVCSLSNLTKSGRTINHVSRFPSAVNPYMVGRFAATYGL